MAISIDVSGRQSADDFHTGVPEGDYRFKIESAEAPNDSNKNAVVLRNGKVNGERNP